MSQLSKGKRVLLKTLIAASLLTSFSVFAQTGTIKIGVLAPLTGAGGPFGKEEVLAAQKAAEYINQSGGILGKKIEILVEDDESNPTAGVAAARKLIDVGGVSAITGIWASGVALAVRPIAIERNVAIMMNGSANEFTQGDSKGLAWRFMALGTDWGAAFGRAATKEPIKTASVLVLQNPFTLSMVDSFTKEVTKTGAKVLDVVPYNPNQTSYRAEVEKVFSKNPDIVFVPGYITDFSAIAREIYRSGYTSKIITLTHAADSQGQFTKNVGKQVAEGINNILPVPSPDSKAFQLYSKLTNTPQGSTEIFGPSVFDQVVVTALAIEKAKSDRAIDFTKHFPSVVNGPGPDVSDPVEALKLIRSGKPFRYSGAYADFKFTSHGDPTNLTYGHYIIRDGVNTLTSRFK